jgi:hypothetical protein
MTEPRLIQSSLTRRGELLPLFPALKRRAKLKRRSAAKADQHVPD